MVLSNQTPNTEGWEWGWCSVSFYFDETCEASFDVSRFQGCSTYSLAFLERLGGGRSHSGLGFMWEHPRETKKQRSFSDSELKQYQNNKGPEALVFSQVRTSKSVQCLAQFYHKRFWCDYASMSRDVLSCELAASIENPKLQVWWMSLNSIHLFLSFQAHRRSLRDAPRAQGRKFPKGVSVRRLKI